MISIQKLQQAVFESREFDPAKLVKRPKYLDWLSKAANNPLIKAVVGFRRSGKSFLLKMLSRSLIDNGVAPSNIFYLNFENDLLIDIKNVKDLRYLWEMYLREVADLNSPIYIIWDEVQLVLGWEKLVRSLYEQNKYNIFISGSNSQLLSGELSSSLSGRSLQLEVRPFSFREYLDYRHLDLNSYYSHKPQIDQAFMVYLYRGGIAEQFDLDADFSANYQSGLIQKIILDDIVKRYNIDNVNTLREVFEFIRGNITSTLSLRKIVNRLDNQGLKVSPTTIDNYINYWGTTYALERLTKFDYRLSRVFDRSAKYYVVDNLLIKGGREADEKRLENLVFNELIRRYGRANIFFGQDANGYEIDFIVKSQEKFLTIQVCLQLNDQNAKREFGNLILADKHLKSEGVVLFVDDIRTHSTPKNAKPVIEWLGQKPY
ncbi:MAG: ATPase [Microgenomates group bacterium Gr01-1014_16]|nr:MAG: ATPase [Microgenomates group bacterium Gr01-1014_16]